MFRNQKDEMKSLIVAVLLILISVAAVLLEGVETKAYANSSDVDAAMMAVHLALPGR